MLNESKELAEVISSCGGIIYIDNPPLSSDEKREKINQKKREASRKVVMDHLAENCQEIYPFGEWNNIYKVVDDYIKEREKIEESNSSTKEEELSKLRGKITESITVHLAKELPVAAIEYSTQNK